LHEKTHLSDNLPDKDEVFDLFLTTGWNENYQLSKEELYTAVKESWYMISAYDNDRLVGFGRIICDGVVHALILDMIVHPAYKRKGIGSRILKNLVEKCHEHNIRDIQLFCAKNQKNFYEKHGFVPRPENAPGMEKSKKL
jgi:N-acetylglutamate synthase-like GNAT family acetyltransferase